MRLTPLDIRKQEFARSFRGLDADEVTSFLQLVSNQWEELLTEQRNLEQKVRDAEAKLDHYLKVEEALQEALRTARESSKQALENAQYQANQLLREAERRSIEIKRAAEQDRLSLKREVGEMRTRQHEIVARLRAFLHSELELLERFEPASSPVRSAPDIVSDDRLDAEETGLGIQLSVSSSQATASSAEQTAAELDRAWLGEVSEPAPAEPPIEPKHALLNGEPSVPPATTVHREEGRGSGWIVRPVISAPATLKTQATEEQPLVEDEHASEGPPAEQFVARSVETSKPEPEPREPSAQEGEVFSLSASEDEIERIRRILKDLE